MNDKYDEIIQSLQEEIQHLQEALVKAQEDRVKLRKIEELEKHAAKLRAAIADTNSGVSGSNNLNISRSVVSITDLNEYITNKSCVASYFSNARLNSSNETKLPPPPSMIFLFFIC